MRSFSCWDRVKVIPVLSRFYGIQEVMNNVIWDEVRCSQVRDSDALFYGEIGSSV